MGRYPEGNGRREREEGKRKNERGVRLKVGNRGREKKRKGAWTQKVYKEPLLGEGNEGRKEGREKV